jgi:CDP-4-dehydro-6-deoxyglucose reductase
VASGKVRKIRNHDFVLSSQEQQQGYCLACSNTAVTDLLIEANEALSPKDLPRQQIRCNVRKLESVSDALLLVHVQTPRTQTLRFMAGQRVTVTLESGEKRDLAVASCPCDGRNLQFLVRLRGGDPFTEQLAASQKGETLLVQGPHGDFLLEEEAIESAVFVAVGDGFGPIKSQIEHAIAIDNAARMLLFRIDSAPHGGPLGNLCRSWDDALDNLRYRRLAADTSAAEAVKTIATACGELADCRLYVAGPPSWVQEFLTAAKAKGARDDYLRGDFLE